MSSPPKYILKFFHWFCDPDYVEDIEGDLLERFEKRKENGESARWLYMIDVLKLFRPGIIRSFEGPKNLNTYGMFRNYLKTSIRNLRKNVLFSTINTVGLAIGMSVGILMILLISELKSYDQFHEKKNKIYRVTTDSKIRDSERHLTSASYFVGDQIKEQVPGVEQVLIMRPGMSADLVTKTGVVSLSGYYTTPSFFDVFSFELLKGNPQTALSDPNNVVLTETVAKKLFGDEDPIGKTLDLESTGGWQKRSINGLITGVVEDPPINSHIQFESLISFSTYDIPAIGHGWKSDYKVRPIDYQQNFVYLVLGDQTRKEEVESVISEIMAEYNSTAKEPITHLLQPLDEFVTSDSYVNRTGPMFSEQRIHVMVGLTIIVLLSACFNYTNLSLARSLRRSKEVGIRKVAGATHSQLFSQFIIEAILLSLMALVVGLGLFFFIKPGFLSLPNPSAQGHQMFTLNIRSVHLLSFVAFAIGLGTLAGLSPALFLSRLTAKIIFYDASKIKLFTGVSFRRLLTIFQFALSIGLIMCALFVHKQYQFALNYDHGYTTENIVNIKIKGDNVDLLENAYANMPEVIATSKSSMILGVGSAQLGLVTSEDKNVRTMLLQNYVDEKYFEMHDFKIIAGTGFVGSAKENAPKQIVVNEALVKALDLGTNEEAIGKIVLYRGRTRVQIVGVIKDFVNIALNVNDQDAYVFVQPTRKEQFMTLGVKIKNDQLIKTIKKLAETYGEIDPNHPFEAEFYNDQIATIYQPQKTTYTITAFLAFLAISISTLGLLGMAVFTTESRMKEISIRKVLGASMKNLSLLLSRSFLVMIIVAGLIAIPVTRYIVDDLLLNDFLYRAKISALDMLSGLLIVLLIGVMTIGWQIREATIQNPADLLRDE